MCAHTRPHARARNPCSPQAVKAMRFEPGALKSALETADDAKERARAEEELAQVCVRCV